MNACSPEAHWRLVVYTGTVSGIPLQMAKEKSNPLKIISFYSITMNSPLFASYPILDNSATDSAYPAV